MAKQRPDTLPAPSCMTKKEAGKSHISEESMEAILPLPTQKRAQEIALLLTAEGVPHRVVRDGGTLTLWVDPVDGERCGALIAIYDTENRVSPPDPWSLTPSWSGLFAAGVILAVFIKTGSLTGFEEPVRRYAASSSRILSGEWFRILTALFLHADGPHLLGNMAGLIIFATGVFQICGDGVGWALLLTASALANAVNATWFAGMGHISFGASTLVFAAAGLLASATTLIRLKVHHPLWKALLPLGAGVTILAFSGAGPGSDVTGHLLGFAFGLAAGVVPAMAPKKQPPLTQNLSLALAALICCLSFYAGTRISI